MTRGTAPGTLLVNAQLLTKKTSGPPTASTDLGDEEARSSRARGAARVHRRPKGHLMAKDMIRIRKLKCVVCGGAIESVLARFGSVSCSHCR
jgi:hypothetical protein